MARWSFAAVAVLWLTGLGICACGGGSSPAGASIAVAQEATTPEVPTEPADGAADPAPTPAADDDDSARGEAGAQPDGSGSACTEVPRELPLAERCAKAGAVVHTFPNTCVGKCRAMENQGMMCGQAMTQGCRCPEGQCIDDRTGCCREIQK